MHARTKHIDIRHHFIREKVVDGSINLVYCPTESMIADALTKPVSKERFCELRDQMGVKKIPGDG